MVGVAVAVGTGAQGVGVLAVFLVTSSLLTPGGGRRTPAQVLANGGVAAASAVLVRWHPDWRLAFAGAVAAAAADTWSTEIGARSRAAPRLITTFEPVEAGTSGGITLLGTLGGVCGAAVIAVAAGFLGVISSHHIVRVTAAGVLGGILDSVLGATVQARFRCTGCGALLEERRHACVGGEAEARLERGVAWLGNDAVNLLATLLGAGLALSSGGRPI